MLTKEQKTIVICLNAHKFTFLAKRAKVFFTLNSFDGIAFLAALGATK